MRRRCFILGLLLLFFGCKEDTTHEEATPLNSFSMRLNDQFWKSSQIEEDACIVKFHCAWSSITKNNVENVFYTIEAYGKAETRRGFSDEKKENRFDLQIFDVDSMGKYGINGSYKEDFTSYASFIDEDKRFVNSANPVAFVVEIDEIIPIEGFSKPGIKGTFYGTLYHEDNPQDSLTIQRGDFIFHIINRYNFNQCPY